VNLLVIFTAYVPWLVAVAWLLGGLIAGTVADRSILRRIVVSERVKQNYWLALALNWARAPGAACSRPRSLPAWRNGSS